MSHQAEDHAMEERRYITLILRLALDRGGQLIQGELVDTIDVIPRQFVGIVGLNQAVQEWLVRQQQTEELPQP